MILGPYPRRPSAWDRYTRVRRAVLPYLVIATVLVVLGTAEGLINRGLKW